MNYLQINNIDNIDIEVFLKEFSVEIIDNFDHRPRSSCLRIPTADDQMVQKLEKIIDYEKLLVYYTIKPVCDIRERG
ncbi:unnamed protein product [Rotaria sordida]|uniref:Uncharacterized protein n=1 Tax=Rotaria sordida TaxID=392033 RepID=A0A819DGC5_9BILA|nr:unnamed protein product [Rotaria sordida]CAF1472968.1 unnamed protein product [Rotaria sordida]CAF3823385.1 unnamed protein product [Rotaria sordida]CAF3839533.1 unnamed protein product [Rotaria sordida]